MPDSVFISHNSADKPFARRVAADLQRSGANVWLDEQQILLGSSIQESIQQAIDKYDYLAVILSPESVASKWVRQELRQALDREISSDKVVVLPLLLRDCDIPGFLRDKKYADFRTDALYDPSLNDIKKRLGLPLTDTAEQSDMSERLDVIAQHDLFNGLIYLDHQLEWLSNQHPDIAKRLKPVAAIARRIRRASKRTLSLKAFIAGTYRLRRTRIDVVRIIREQLADLEILTGPRNGITSELVVSGFPSFDADTDLIEVALYNMLDNAHKYSARGGKVIVQLHSDNHQNQIHIRNRGFRASENADADIFQRGFRGREATAVSIGSGHGLYLAKLIVAAHGGEIKYNYDANQEENIFTIVIPASTKVA